MPIYANDTIVAIATPSGEGAVGIVRLSGPEAARLSDQHLRLKTPLSATDNYRIRHGHLVLENQETDEILAFVARSPRSYTGEDMVEIQCHGNPVLLKRLVTALELAGARPAEPGEFTQRAFMNGKIDLTQAEAVADLVSAKTDYGLESAYFQLRGGLKKRFQELATELRQTKTLLEASLDFSEDVTIDTASVQKQLRQAVDILDQQIQSYDGGKMIREGARVTLCGIPNVGKSSLLNALLGEDRAIVTDVAGTTRDTIDEAIEIAGIQVVLSDTAGLRETSDTVEKEGTRRSRVALAQADLVILIVDGSRPIETEEQSLLNELVDPIVAINKSDLYRHPSWDGVAACPNSLWLSARTGDGLTGLRQTLSDRLCGGVKIGTESITNRRHAGALRLAREALSRAAVCLEEAGAGEIISFEIDEGLTALVGIIGETTAQDILDEIFSQFCIGK